MLNSMAKSQGNREDKRKDQTSAEVGIVGDEEVREGK